MTINNYSGVKGNEYRTISINYDNGLEYYYSNELLMGFKINNLLVLRTNVWNDRAYDSNMMLLNKDNRGLVLNDKDFKTLLKQICANVLCAKKYPMPKNNLDLQKIMLDKGCEK